MAVKVMVAAAIANAALEKRVAARRDGAAPAKPKRRRSSVFDASGNEVFITLMCLKCRKTRPLSQFGLRKMTDGAIRNQPWCRACRTGSRARGAGSHEPEESVEPSAVELPAREAAPAATPPSPAQRPSSSVAAEIAAALAAGMRR